MKPANVLLVIPYQFNDMLWAVSNQWELTAIIRPDSCVLAVRDLTLGVGAAEQKDHAKEFSTWLEARPPWCHITDFGLGKFSAAAGIAGRYTIASHRMIGTPGFMAPETLSDRPQFSAQSDIYSLGCLLYSLCSCKLPPSPDFPSANIPMIPDGYPKRLRDVIARCMQFDPGERPNSREVVNEISEAYADILEDVRFGNMKSKLANARGLEAPSTIPANAVVRRDESIALSMARAEVPTQYRKISQPELDNLLRDALYKGNVNGMKTFIDAGADVNAKAFDFKRVPGGGFSGQQLAAARGVQEYYPEFDIERMELLQFAAIMGWVERVSVLLQSDAKYNPELFGSNPLFLAASVNGSELIGSLVKSWAFDIKVKTNGDLRLSRNQLVTVI
ncbi:hypothetical protein ABW20_dc0110646 [Dactylellina cionopaga]|nr:hypothetical protein ABW20_dc0110646 [Dactylellina cionopaga]